MLSDFVVIDEITAEDGEQCSEHRRKRRKISYFYSCRYCVQKFGSSSHLDDHILRKHKIQCNFCDRTLESMSKYCEHFERKHFDIEPICKCCGRVFGTTVRFVEHLTSEIHQWNINTRTIRCVVCRQKGIRSLEMYNIHMREDHASWAPLKCNMCSLELKTVSEFVKHIVLNHRHKSTK